MAWQKNSDFWFLLLRNIKPSRIQLVAGADSKISMLLVIIFNWKWDFFLFREEVLLVLERFWVRFFLIIFFFLFYFIMKKNWKIYYYGLTKLILNTLALIHFFINFLKWKLLKIILYHIQSIIKFIWSETGVNKHVRRSQSID